MSGDSKCPICRGDLESIYNLSEEGPDSHVLVRCVAPPRMPFEAKGVRSWCGAEWSLSTGVKQ